MGLPITTFADAANGGTYWGIVGPIEALRCGVHANKADDSGEPWTLGPSLDPAYDGIYRLGATVASPPAVT